MRDFQRILRLLLARCETDRQRKGKRCRNHGATQNEREWVANASDWPRISVESLEHFGEQDESGNADADADADNNGFD